MRLYRCDQCKTERFSAEVEIRGISRLQDGGILIPEHSHLYHFCGAECAWKWLAKGVDDLRQAYPRMFPK